ncbi:MAG: four-helix bundle copper-binding protein [Acidobacteria bacterium]|nr:four-helix bundle copper-binding protein [Acidobacteriota bacterium]
MSSQAINQKDTEMQNCIQACLECHRICVETLVHSLQTGGRQAEARHLRLLLDCAEICQTSANFMLRGSELHRRICAVCAEVCEWCAQSCDQFGEDDMMRACAETCRHCAQSCRTMAAQAA